MKKNFILFLFIIGTIIIFLSCTINNNQPAEPTPEITEGPTPEATEGPTPEATEEPIDRPTPEPTEEQTPETTPDTHVVIAAKITGIEGGGTTEITYLVNISVNDEPYDGATITINGPHENQDVAFTDNGTYQFKINNASYYQAGSIYTVTANIDGTEYEDSITACGGITITESQATWTTEGSADMIVIADSSYEKVFSDGNGQDQDINSPYNFSAHLISGINFVAVACTNVNSGLFSNGADSSSELIIEYAKVEMVLNF